MKNITHSFIIFGSFSNYFKNVAEKLLVYFTVMILQWRGINGDCEAAFLHTHETAHYFLICGWLLSAPFSPQTQHF